jgi:hypothetical protein
MMRHSLPVMPFLCSFQNSQHARPCRMPFACLGRTRAQAITLALLDESQQRIECAVPFPER